METRGKSRNLFTDGMDCGVRCNTMVFAMGVCGFHRSPAGILRTQIPTYGGR